MPAGSYITESKFIAVWIMIRGGATNQEIAEYLNVSTSSVTRIKNCQTFEEYQNYRKGNAFMAKKAAEEKKKAEEEKRKAEEALTVAKAEQPAQIIEHRQSVTLVANHYMAEQLQKHTELLTIISNKLGAIIDDLYGTKKEG